MMLTEKLRRGGVLLMILLLGLVGALILAAGIRFLVVTFRQTTEQVQRAQAISAAESGVMYTIWMLNTVKIGADSLPSLQNEPITAAPTDEEVANFTLSYTVDQVDGKDRVKVVSVGKDTVRTDIEETVRATLMETDPDLFTITSWQHDL